MAITTQGKSQILNFLSTNLSHMTLNDDLGEFFRKQISDKFVDSDTLILDMYLDESEANDTLIELISVFGFGATIAFDSGVRFSSNTANFEKTDAETLTISAEIQIVEV